MNNRSVLWSALVIISLLGAGAGGFYVGARPGPGSDTHSTISSTTSVTSISADHLRVLATFFPVYDMATGVLGNKGNVTLLVPETVDVHDFEPTPRAIQQVATANILIYNGAGLEPWIPQIVAAANNPRLVLVNSSAGLPLMAVPTPFQKDNRTIDPHVWNEPTSGVDTKSAGEFYGILEGLNRDRGITMILALHDIGMVTRLSTRIACMNGSLFFCGKTSDFAKSSALSKVYGYPVEFVRHGDHA